MAGLTDDKLTWLEVKTLKGSSRVSRQWQKTSGESAWKQKPIGPAKPSVHLLDDT